MSQLSGHLERIFVYKYPWQLELGITISWCNADNIEREKQAGAKLYQAQGKLGIAKPALPGLRGHLPIEK